MMLPFLPALNACYLQSSAAYIWDFGVWPWLLLQGRRRCAPTQVLLTAVQCGELEGHRAEPVFQVLSDEQARVESSPGMLHTRDLQALSG